MDKIGSNSPRIKEAGSRGSPELRGFIRKSKSPSPGNNNTDDDDKALAPNPLAVHASSRLLSQPSSTSGKQSWREQGTSTTGSISRENDIGRGRVNAFAANDLAALLCDHDPTGGKRPESIAQDGYCDGKRSVSDNPSGQDTAIRYAESIRDISTQQSGAGDNQPSYPLQTQEETIREIQNAISTLTPEGQAQLYRDRNKDVSFERPDQTEEAEKNNKGPWLGVRPPAGVKKTKKPRKKISEMPEGPEKKAAQERNRERNKRYRDARSPDKKAYQTAMSNEARRRRKAAALEQVVQGTQKESAGQKDLYSNLPDNQEEAYRQREGEQSHQNIAAAELETEGQKLVKPKKNKKKPRSEMTPEELEELRAYQREASRKSALKKRQEKALEEKSLDKNPKIPVEKPSRPSIPWKKLRSEMTNEEAAAAREYERGIQALRRQRKKQEEQERKT